MPVALQEVVAIAQQLGTLLKRQEHSADSLILKSKSLLEKIDKKQQCVENIDELKDLVHKESEEIKKPSYSFVLGTPQQSAALEKLEQENESLRCKLEEHQCALELLMSHYRHGMARCTLSKEKRSLVHHSDMVEATSDMNRICEMIEILHKVARIDELVATEQTEKFAQLQLENNTLRELSASASRFLNVGVPTCNACVQTSDPEEFDEECQPFASCGIDTIKRRKLITVISAFSEATKAQCVSTTDELPNLSSDCNIPITSLFSQNSKDVNDLSVSFDDSIDLSSSSGSNDSIIFNKSACSIDDTLTLFNASMDSVLPDLRDNLDIDVSCGVAPQLIIDHPIATSSSQPKKGNATSNHPISVKKLISKSSFKSGNSSDKSRTIRKSSSLLNKLSPDNSSASALSKFSSSPTKKSSVSKPMEVTKPKKLSSKSQSTSKVSPISKVSGKVPSNSASCTKNKIK